MRRIFAIISAISVLFAISMIASAENSRVYDFAEVLSDNEILELENKIREFRSENRFDIAIVTSIGLYSSDLMEAADDFYDECDFGYGENKDGVLLLVNISENKEYYKGNSWVSTCGNGQNIITSEDISSFGKKVTPLLYIGDYEEAFEDFIDFTEDELDSSARKKVLIPIGTAIMLGLVGAFIYTTYLKNQLKTVVTANDADNYLVTGSLIDTRAYDHYLYSTISKTKISSKSDTHSSSSGSTHGGGGF